MPSNSETLDALAVIDALDCSSVSVLGVRSSGVAALELAARHGHRVDALIMLNTVSEAAQTIGQCLVSGATSENCRGSRS